MLRLLYRCILRLPPPYFRSRFSADMQWIFELTNGKLAQAAGRRHCTGFWHEPLAVPNTPLVPDGTALFHTLDTFKPRVGALFYGAILSSGVLWAACVVMQYSWNHTIPIRTAGFEYETNLLTMVHRGAPVPIANHLSAVMLQSSSRRWNPKQFAKTWFGLFLSFGRSSSLRAQARESTRYAQNIEGGWQGINGSWTQGQPLALEFRRANEMNDFLRYVAIIHRPAMCRRRDPWQQLPVGDLRSHMTCRSCWQIPGRSSISA